MTAGVHTLTTHPLGHPWPIDEAANALSITSRFLRSLLAEESIQSIRLGRRILIPDIEMRRVMAEGVVRQAVQK